MTEHVSATIGATPLIKLERLSEEIGATVYVKFEASNPGGSIKDRAAMNMIDAAEARGEIAPGRSVLVEPTSGNTGIGIAMIGAARGYDVVLTMPESMSKERRMLLAAYGAKLVLTPAAEGMAGAVAEAERIERETPGAWIVGQFTNPDNPAAHEKTTGPRNQEGPWRRQSRLRGCRGRHGRHDFGRGPFLQRAWQIPSWRPGGLGGRARSHLCCRT